MSKKYEKFKTYLKKIGSGEFTGKSMSREESAEATRLILKKEASAAQIGAFMIAHRIRRPEPEELAGMLDAYLELGPKIYSPKTHRRPIFFGTPFDGRTKTAPIFPLTTLLLTSQEQPIILHGGSRMPIKYGVSHNELFQALGLNLSGLSILQLQKCFIENKLALLYQPDHFPLADHLISYRDQIGKRPPLASMELLWTCHIGSHLHISGYFHSPTEKRHWKTLELMGEEEVITIRGLEGGIDLSTNHPTTIGHYKNNNGSREVVNPVDFEHAGKDMEWKNIQGWQKSALLALRGEGPLTKSLEWNSGIYFVYAGLSSNIQEGIEQTKQIIKSGLALKHLEKLIKWREKIQIN
tara:strand:+ start:7373 stop:8431 length:1059 start_codon:yes stop_codon:yes gene_type:complete